jgi:hypothetical protein
MIWTTGASGDLSNIHVEVSVSSTGLAEDPGMAIVCGYIDDEHLYYLGITPDGFFAIGKIDGDDDVIFTNDNNKWGRSMFVAQKAESYRLEADCGADGTLILRVDGVEVASANDTSFPSGAVGLLARTFDVTPAEVRYDNLLVTALP